jgi:hypothetical protein
MTAAIFMSSMEDDLLAVFRQTRSFRAIRKSPRSRPLVDLSSERLDGRVDRLQKMSKALFVSADANSS